MSAWLGFLPNVSSHCRTVTICARCHDNTAGYFPGVSTIEITFIVGGRKALRRRMCLLGRDTDAGQEERLHYIITEGDLPGAWVPRIERWQASSRGAHGVE